VIVATTIFGALIGSVGIGGVLLTPTLIYLAGLNIHTAMGTSMLAFIFTGIVGTASYARRGSLDWSAATPIAVGAMPGALLGAWANGLVSEAVLKLILAVLLMGIGIYALAGARRQRRVRVPSRPALAAVGVMIGFGSGLTGTGGPVLAVPTLLLLGLPALPAVAISQLCQLPTSIFGTAGYLLSDHVDVALGVGLGILASAGVLAGARIAHTVAGGTLHIAVGLACIGAGIAIAVATAVA
jgi:uncharacterized membrane protein YfcA